MTFDSRLLWISLTKYCTCVLEKIRGSEKESREFGTARKICRHWEYYIMTRESCGQSHSESFGEQSASDQRWGQAAPGWERILYKTSRQIRSEALNISVPNAVSMTAVRLSASLSHVQSFRLFRDNKEERYIFINSVMGPSLAIQQFCNFNLLIKYQKLCSAFSYTE